MHGCRRYAVGQRIAVAINRRDLAIEDSVLVQADRVVARGRVKGLARHCRVDRHWYIRHRRHGHRDRCRLHGPARRHGVGEAGRTVVVRCRREIQGAVGLQGDRTVVDQDRRSHHHRVAVNGSDRASGVLEAVAADHGDIDRRVLIGRDRVVGDIHHCRDCDAYRRLRHVARAVVDADDEAVTAVVIRRRCIRVRARCRVHRDHAVRRGGVNAVNQRIAVAINRRDLASERSVLVQADCVVAGGRVKGLARHCRIHRHRRIRHRGDGDRNGCRLHGPARCHCVREVGRAVVVRSRGEVQGAVCLQGDRTVADQDRRTHHHCNAVDSRDGATRVLEAVVADHRDVDRRVFIRRDRVVDDIHHRRDRDAYCRLRHVAFAVIDADDEAVAAVVVGRRRVGVRARCHIHRHHAVHGCRRYAVGQRIAVAINRRDLAIEDSVLVQADRVVARGRVKGLARHCRVDRHWYIRHRRHGHRDRCRLHGPARRHGVGEAGRTVVVRCRREIQGAVGLQGDRTVVDQDRRAHNHRVAVNGSDRASGVLEAVVADHGDVDGCVLIGRDRVVGDIHHCRDCDAYRRLRHVAFAVVDADDEAVTAVVIRRRCVRVRARCRVHRHHAVRGRGVHRIQQRIAITIHCRDLAIEGSILVQADCVVARGRVKDLAGDRRVHRHWYIRHRRHGHRDGCRLHHAARRHGVREAGRTVVVGGWREVQRTVGLQRHRTVVDQDRRSHHHRVAVNGSDRASGVLEAVVADHDDIDRRVLIGRDRVVGDIHHCRDCDAYRRLRHVAFAIVDADDEAIAAVVVCRRRVGVRARCRVHRDHAVRGRSIHPINKRVSIAIHRRNLAVEDPILVQADRVVARGRVEDLARDRRIDRHRRIRHGSDGDRDRCRFHRATRRHGVGEAGRTVEVGDGREVQGAIGLQRDRTVGNCDWRTDHDCITVDGRDGAPDVLEAVVADHCDVDRRVLIRRDRVVGDIHHCRDCDAYRRLRHVAFAIVDADDEAVGTVVVGRRRVGVRARCQVHRHHAVRGSRGYAVGQRVSIAINSRNLASEDSVLVQADRVVARGRVKDLAGDRRIHRYRRIRHRSDGDRDGCRLHGPAGCHGVREAGRTVVVRCRREVQGAVGLQRHRTVGHQDRRSHHHRHAVDGSDRATRILEAVVAEHGDVDRCVLIGRDRVVGSIRHGGHGHRHRRQADVARTVVDADDEAVSTVVIRRRCVGVRARCRIHRDHTVRGRGIYPINKRVSIAIHRRNLAIEGPILVQADRVVARGRVEDLARDRRVDRHRRIRHGSDGDRDHCRLNHTARGHGVREAGRAVVISSRGEVQGAVGLQRDRAVGNQDRRTHRHRHAVNGRDGAPDVLEAVVPDYGDVHRRIFIRRDRVVGDIHHCRNRDAHHRLRHVAFAIVDADDEAVAAVVVRRGRVGVGTRRRIDCHHAVRGSREYAVGQRVAVAINSRNLAIEDSVFVQTDRVVARGRVKDLAGDRWIHRHRRIRHRGDGHRDRCRLHGPAGCHGVGEAGRTVVVRCRREIQGAIGLQRDRTVGNHDRRSHHHRHAVDGRDTASGVLEAVVADHRDVDRSVFSSRDRVVGNIRHGGHGHRHRRQADVARAVVDADDEAVTAVVIRRRCVRVRARCRVHRDHAVRGRSIHPINKRVSIAINRRDLTIEHSVFVQADCIVARGRVEDLARDCRVDRHRRIRHRRHGHRDRCRLHRAARGHGVREAGRAVVVQGRREVQGAVGFQRHRTVGDRDRRAHHHRNAVNGRDRASGVLEAVVADHRDIDRCVFIGRDRVVDDIHHRRHRDTYRRLRHVAFAVIDADDEAIAAVVVGSRRIGVRARCRIHRHHAVRGCRGYAVGQRVAVTIHRRDLAIEGHVLVGADRIVAGGRIIGLTRHCRIHRHRRIGHRRDRHRDGCRLNRAARSDRVGETG
ncbi:hypothetical protein LMG5911_05759 [Achromobacter spanius]|nr:hypothetical protein LMG5911_05759 [Achromobacter spanius]